MASESETQRPKFNGIYLDTNVLIAQGWPRPSILLNNVLRYAAVWGIQTLLPDPVTKEAEDHWLRDVKRGISEFDGAQKNLQRLASPIPCEVKGEHTPVEKLLEGYRAKVAETLKEYAIIQVPFTKRPLEDVFEFATKYVLPFVPDAKGRGFQDAVILFSILDHLNEFPEASAIFISADNDFKDIRLTDFLSGFDSKRLEIVKELDVVFNRLWKPYFDETVIKPYRQEIENAKTAAQGILSELTIFIKSNLTEDILKPGIGDQVLKILSVEDVRILSVDTPLPTTDEPLNRTVTIQINVSSDCRVLVSRDYSFLKSVFRAYSGDSPDESDLPPPPEELELKVNWSGGIEATADIVDTKFKNVVLKTLVPQKPAF
jgi:PIN domain